MIIGLKWLVAQDAEKWQRLRERNLVSVFLRVSNSDVSHVASTLMPSTVMAN